MSLLSESTFQPFTVYYGDIHNHCNLSYGRGSLDEALRNARLQLDFASITIHAAWPDIPTDDPELEYLVDYHKVGFEKALAGWKDYTIAIDAQNEDGKFITFPSFEWHSMQYGDHCIYYKSIEGSRIIDAPDLAAMRDVLRTIDTPTLLIPHHIGYKQGSRGINWDAFTDELSPVAEIFSFHGLSEGGEGPYPYLHSMGPAHEHSTAHYGWAQGNIFGVVGSTDHHAAFPGCYGYGMMGVWADDLTRDGIWDAVTNRRTYVLTGDRIQLAFAVNDTPMGSIAPAADNRQIQVAVQGGSSLDYIDVLHSNQLVHRETVFPTQTDSGIFKIHVEAGWGEREDAFDWDIELTIDEGTLRNVEPRLRGYGPADVAPDDADYAYHQLETDTPNQVRLITKTRKNTSLHTPATEGFAIEIEGTSDTTIHAIINGVAYDLRLEDLLTGARTFYTSGFVSPVVCFHRAVPEAEFTHEFTFEHHQQSVSRDWYTIRVRQHNHQWAWSSPVWVDGLIT